jgi:hypothetical protein
MSVVGMRGNIVQVILVSTLENKLKERKFYAIHATLLICFGIIHQMLSGDLVPMLAPSLDHRLSWLVGMPLSPPLV